MFVGGEFYYDERWAAEGPGLLTGQMTFLNGGRACLTLIGSWLLDHGIQRVLLPSYLCPSILTTLENGGLTYEFYQVREDFSIDLEDLARRIDLTQAVYFINYFGFHHNAETLQFFRELQQAGVTVVEDNAQAAFTNLPIGDFIFNSLRKFVPYDGGYLISPYEMQPYLEPYLGRPNRRLPLIRAYRQQLGDYLLDGKGSHPQLEALFNQAEAYYEGDGVVEGDPQERLSIERLDWPGMRQARRENYRYLLSLIASLPEVSPIFPDLQAENMPLGLPVYFNGVSRDRIYEDLGSAGIGLLIHWHELMDHSRTCANPRTAAMVGKILTLTIDHRTSHKQMDYLAVSLARAIESAKKG